MRTGASVPTWALAAALAVPFLFLDAPLVETDDARYAELALAMAASGDWVVPSLNGMPYIEKPPLWYWLSAASVRALGPSEAAARLPMALLSVLGCVGTWWLGSWLFSPAVGRGAALACSSAGLWLFLSHYLTLDLPVSVFLLWCTALILRALERPEDAPWAAPAAWLAAALAFLSKGLIALLLPGAWAIGIALLVPRWRRPALKLLSPAGIALALFIVGPWLLAVQRRSPDFLRTFFIEQHFQRYLTPRYNRPGGWWYYLAVIPAGLLPWTAPFAAGLARAGRQPLAEPRAAALAAWVLGVAAFFTVSKSKLPTYALPVLPHAALLAAAALEDGLPSWAKHASLGLGGAAAAAAVTAIALAVGLFPPLPGHGAAEPELVQWIAGLAAAALTSLGAAQLAASCLERPALALGMGGALSGALALAALGASSPLLSARALGRAVREAAVAGDQLWTYGTYPHGLSFYAGRPVDKLVYFVGEFHYAQRDPAHRERFGDDNALRHGLPRAGGKTFLVLRAFELPHVETLLPKQALAGWRPFGPWILAEVRARRG